MNPTVVSDLCEEVASISKESTNKTTALLRKAILAAEQSAAANHIEQQLTAVAGRMSQVEKLLQDTQAAMRSATATTEDTEPLPVTSFWARTGFQLQDGYCDYRIAIEFTDGHFNKINRGLGRGWLNADADAERVSLKAWQAKFEHDSLVQAVLLNKQRGGTGDQPWVCISIFTDNELVWLRADGYIQHVKLSILEQLHSRGSKARLIASKLPDISSVKN